MFAFLAALLLLGAADEPKLQLPPKSPEGIYTLNGIEGDGAYDGVLSIRKRGDGFLVQIAVATEGQHGAVGSASVGIGLLTGDDLSVGWLADKVVGVTVYRFTPDRKTATGRWIGLQTDGLAREEKLLRIGGLPGLR